MVQLWHHRRSRILYRTESCSTAPKGGNRRNEAVVSMRKKSSKQSKVSRIDRSKALAAQADEAIKERIRTAPAYMYTSLCPVPELRRPPKGVIRYYETMLHRQRASRV